jgi:hypothetical protein
MNSHPQEIRCTGRPDCRVPHNRWLAESVKEGRFIPVRGLTIPVSQVVAEMVGPAR